ncbi:MAG TPA: IS110 family transposase [Longimicrobium sp.]|nr:IS110 family transposase [Longimicrobium sp.]
MAIELGDRQWKLGFSIGMGQRPRIRVVESGNLERLAAEIRAARARFKVSEQAPVLSCYEAGRDGFWPHRALTQLGVCNIVVDSSSIEVNRRARRAKSDKLDVVKLCEQLIRYYAGETRVWGVVRVPTPAQEDRRQLQRELVTSRRDRARLVVRIKSLMAGQGVKVGPRNAVPQHPAALRMWNGEPLPERLLERVTREVAKIRMLDLQIRDLERQRKHWLRNASDPVVSLVRKLLKVRGIGPETAWLLVMELFSWRTFNNGRELGALVGLCPTPHQSGTIRHELGITKAGNRRVRAQLVEIAWRWLDYQPQSALTRWYNRRFASGGPPQRKKGIVALARKLLIALWHYLKHDQAIEGAVLKA